MSGFAVASRKSGQPDGRSEAAAAKFRSDCASPSVVPGPAPYPLEAPWGPTSPTSRPGRARYTGPSLWMPRAGEWWTGPWQRTGGPSWSSAPCGWQSGNGAQRGRPTTQIRAASTPRSNSGIAAGKRVSGHRWDRSETATKMCCVGASSLRWSAAARSSSLLLARRGASGGGRIHTVPVFLWDRRLVQPASTRLIYQLCVAGEISNGLRACRMRFTQAADSPPRRTNSRGRDGPDPQRRLRRPCVGCRR